MNLQQVLQVVIPNTHCFVNRKKASDKYLGLPSNVTAFLTFSDTSSVSMEILLGRAIQSWDDLQTSWDVPSCNSVIWFPAQTDKHSLKLYFAGICPLLCTEHSPVHLFCQQSYSNSKQVGAVQTLHGNYCRYWLCGTASCTELQKPFPLLQPRSQAPPVLWFPFNTRSMHAYDASHRSKCHARIGHVAQVSGVEIASTQLDR